MAFNDIPQVPTPQDMMDVALGRGRKAVQGKVRGRTLLAKKIAKARLKIKAISSSLRQSLLQIPQTFPNLDTLLPVHISILKLTINLDNYRLALGRFQKSSKVISTIESVCLDQIRSAQKPSDIDEALRRALGRYGGFCNRLSGPLETLKDARRTIRRMPPIKALPTITICGLPNAGKTTLFDDMTGASAKIAAYAFTTTNINVASLKRSGRKIQLIDTPGLLGRDKNNVVEKEAWYAIKYASDIILFLQDDTPGYTATQQKALLTKIKRLKKPLWIFNHKEALDRNELDSKINEWIHSDSFMSLYDRR